MAINEFDWIRTLSDISVDKKVCYFTKASLDIIHNFIPRKIFPYISNKIKKLISEKNSAYKSYRRFNSDVILLEKFKVLQSQLNMSVEKSKQKYYSKLPSKLANSATNSKTHWSILKTFLNNKIIPCIPHLFYENKFITNFK